MAKYIGKAVSISTSKIKTCKLTPTVTVLCIHYFASTNVHAKPFYVDENQCTQILNLSSPDNNHNSTCKNIFDIFDMLIFFYHSVSNF